MFLPVFSQELNKAAISNRENETHSKQKSNENRTKPELKSFSINKDAPSKKNDSIREFDNTPKLKKTAIRKKEEE